ncbi:MULTISPECIES: pentapeptide repeat-containing protein [unclassified Variovorax]|uniref:pentapeptide repeat-containing protein n=1 Tax=unclassified Variovorax TaxID=663243 RepID=UPI001160B6E9|nr:MULTISPECIES: hypothetical protein [unclassified Variovorax]
MYMQRRSVLRASISLAASAAFTTGFAMVKNNVRTLGKKFDYLQDPELRTREAGDAPLEIRGVVLSGTVFDGLLWRNLKFIDCDFVGAYEIKADMESVAFEDCRFAGIFNFGKLTNVDFQRCLAKANTVVVGGTGSNGVRFSDCIFIGTETDPNRWGGMGSYGETEFTRCKMKWTNVVSETRHTIVDCEFIDVDCSVSKDGGGSEVLIERSKLFGKFDMRPATLVSLTVRDTVLEYLDLRDATVKGDVTMERIKGGYINAYVKQAGGLRIRNSQVLGNGRKIFEAYAGGIQSIEIDTVVFGGDLSSEPVTIAGGFSLKSADRISNVSQSIDIRNSTIPTLDASYLHTQRLVLKNNQIMRANMSNSRVADLEISDTRITGKLDFHGTQAAQQKVDLSAGSTFGRVDQMDGSNIRLQPRSAR